ncbi:MAG: peroxiredoxin [Phenylobacterium sp.]|uniref:peroxiredoxin family protein n=1 Tax=Phenylobacterium sp. TaxID=1871053 RepID=UPI0025F998D8|nr:peroxiredoxin [Phenylobacterium sp.]MBA4014111.1 peroxiredoxin [Phenylobacterium sp.]
MLKRIAAGVRIPPASLAELQSGELTVLSTERLFEGRRAIVMGMPGAFSPTCAQKHLPDFIANAERLRSAGFQLLACVTPNDPWVMDRWAQELDPGRKIRFLSDGNLELTRKLGLSVRADGYHLGERSARYTMILKNAVIEKLAVENTIEEFACTAVDAVLL